jgi:large subunit ribosomal protein L7/L12
MSMMPMMAAGAPAAAAAPAAAEAPAEEKKEKTEFDVKLEGFSPEGKIKVIKEIRALTSLGLKEAKELVSTTAVASGVLLCWCKFSQVCATHVYVQCG